jgi:hypothetical protein
LLRSKDKFCKLFEKEPRQQEVFKASGKRQRSLVTVFTARGETLLSPVHLHVLALVQSPNPL